MLVTLLSATPPKVVVKAIRMCHDSFDKIDSDDCIIGPNDAHLIKKIIISKGHESVSEHCSFVWEIEGLSEYAHVHLIRHRIGVSFSVQSTRYTLVKRFLKSDEPAENFITDTHNEELMEATKEYMEKIRRIYNDSDKKIDNDIINQHIPRIYKLNMIVTFNIRSMRHFIKLRTSNAAHYEIRDLANEMLGILNNSEYKIFFEDLGG